MNQKITIRIISKAIPANFHAFFILIAAISIHGCTTAPTVAFEKLPSSTMWIESCSDWDEWDKPGPPFRIFGNSYYVGTCGITAILIAGREGHILIDGGTEAGAASIAANIESLGFAVKDVKVLLHSHEHFDHVAGLAKLQELSGAQLLASPQAAPVLRTGVSALDDPQAGMHEGFPKARVDRVIQEGETVKLGELSLAPIATPGHTPGALTWQWQSCEKDRCLSIVYADSLSPISSENYRFGDHPAYVAAYRAGLSKLATLDCGILLTPHPSASDMRSRLGNPRGLEDNTACKSYADLISARLEKRLAEEVKGKSDPHQH
jgi:metallo-beta-lactamase class B